MVFCVIVGCSNESSREKGNYSRIPAIRYREGIEEQRRSEERRRLWIKAIARDDLSEKKLMYERVCFRHFVSGKL